MVIVMNWSTFIFLFFVLLVNVIHYAESSPHHSSRFRKIHRGFRSFFCRLRHRKVVFDLKGKAGGCARRCPSDYQERYSLRWGHHCKPIVLPEGCADQYCIQCISGYKWFYTFPRENRCIKECPAGYMTRNGNMCDKCLADGCTQCANIFICSKCEGNRALHTTVGGIRITCEEKCPQNYKKMKIQGIVKCVMNSIVTEPPTTKASPTTNTPFNTTLAPTTKEVLPSGCKDKDCTNCEKAFVKFYAPTGGAHHCLNECPQGYTNLNSICVGCSDRRCASCKSSLVECERCFPNYAMLLDALNNTVECVLNCPRKHELTLLNNISVCMIKPEPKCPVMNCKRCVRSNLHVFHRGCEECNKGFKLFRGTFNDHCYTTCPSGYFDAVRPGTGIITCAKCHVPFCNKCMNGSTCEECIGPMVLDTSGRCTTCPAKQSYDFDRKKCVSQKLSEEDKKKRNNVVFELVDESA